MSIGKAQALAIADGFMDSIGSGSVDDLQPRETFSELILLAGEFIEDSQKNLNNSNSNASGELSASLEAMPPVTNPGKVRIDIEMLFYGLFVNSGVKGTRSGSSTSGFSFKSDRPSSKFVDSIASWQKHGKLSTRNTNPKKSISANEKKNASIAELSSAYAIARSIMQKGIKGTGFLDKAEKTTSDKVEDRLGAALEIDIIKSITR